MPVSSLKVWFRAACNFSPLACMCSKVLSAICRAGGKAFSIFLLKLDIPGIYYLAPEGNKTTPTVFSIILRSKNSDIFFI